MSEESKAFLEPKESYDASQIQVLEGLEAVRLRPGMYIGSTSSSGLHHLVYEIVDNAIDEALAGFCTHITVTIEPGDVIRVTDDGRGIPVDVQEQTGKPALEVVYTVLHAGGKFGGGGYKVSGGLHGVGASVVNALSEWLEVEVHRGGSVYQMKFSRGDKTQDMKIIGETDRTGTTVRFKPDPEMFEDTVYDYETLHVRMREQAFLNAGLRITIADERPESANKEESERRDSMCYEGGIREFVSYLNRSKQPLHPDVIYVSGNREDSEAEIALQWNDSYNEAIYAYVNDINTKEGGTHLDGVKIGLTVVMNKFLETREKLLKRINDKDSKVSEKLTGEDVRSGLTAVLSVKVPEPQFEGQTKTKLGNSEVRSYVDSLVKEKLTLWCEQNPQLVDKILEKAVGEAAARIAARKAKDSARRKTGLGFGLPAKLADCSLKDPSQCEVYIVEGDSAGGSAKTARDRATQAILPLRGKILNVEKARLDKIYGNEEIKAMITAFGTGIKEEFDITKLRYDKIIIMTDADVDGAHIATLMLTFLYRYMPELIKQGHVYLAKPPLYKLERNKKVWYAYSDAELDSILAEVGRDNNNRIQRYKGLGEMDASQLWETTMDPERRILLRVNMDEETRSELDLTFVTLMGDEVEPRREFIEERAKDVKNLDI